MVNYTRAWAEANFGIYFKNSLWVTGVSTTLILFLASMVSFVLGRISFRLNPWINMFFVDS